MFLNPTSTSCTAVVGQQSNDARDSKDYSSGDLPNVGLASHHPQSTLRMAEELITRLAVTHHDELVTVATRPTGLEGLPGFSQTSLSPNDGNLTAPATGLTSEQTTSILHAGVRTLDELIAEQVQGAAPESAVAIEQMVTAVEALVQGEYEQAQTTVADTAAKVMVDHIVNYFQTSPQSLFERAKILLDFFGTVLRNEFEGTGARWAANVNNAVLRDLATVGLTTTLRQLAGMALESRFILDDLAPEARQWIGASVMLLGPCLNILGAMRDELNGTATNTSRLARGAMLGLSLGVLVAALVVNPPTPLSQAASFVTQVTIYTVLRDLMQLFIPLKDNTTSLNGPSTAIAGAGYGGIQVGFSWLMDTLAPNSGAGFPMGVTANIESATESLKAELLAQLFADTASTASTADVRDQIVSAIEALRPQLSHDVMRGLFNTLAEVGDDLLRPAIARHREVQALIATTRREAMAEGRDPEEAVQNIPAEQLQGLRIYFDTPRLPIVGSGFPTTKNFLDQMLTTGAMRTSIFQAIMGTLLTSGTVLGQLGLSATQQSWASYGVLAAVIQVGYTPFLLAHATQPAPPANEGGSDEYIAMQSMGVSPPINAESHDEMLETRQ